MNAPFDDAVIRHGPTVLRVCRAVLGAGDDADDAWQETFIAALRAWPDLPAEINVEAWLVRVAQRKAIDATRARARRAVPTDLSGEDPPSANPHRARTSAGHDSSGAEDGVWDAVASLPERQRLAVAYHHLGGLPHAETARIIGGSAASVRRACADGLAALRRTYRVTPRPDKQDGEHDGQHGREHQGDPRGHDGDHDGDHDGAR